MWTWGWNNVGPLGDGTTEDRGHPAPIEGLPPIAAVAAGIDWTLLLDETGRIWAFGWNEDGQLGDGTTEDRHKPVPGPGLRDVTAVGAGWPFSWAVTKTGALWVWGAYPLQAGPLEGSRVPVLARRTGPPGHYPQEFGTFFDALTGTGKR